MTVTGLILITMMENHGHVLFLNRSEDRDQNLLWKEWFFLKRTLAEYLDSISMIYKHHTNKP